jgi:hypothetical protein
MPIKKAKLKTVINQPLAFAIGFVAGILKNTMRCAVQQKFCE